MAGDLPNWNDLETDAARPNGAQLPRGIRRQRSNLGKLSP
jgi:hypothetical protein